MQQTTRSYLTTFVAKGAVLLFCSVLVHGVHIFANPSIYPQQKTISSISNIHMDAGNAGDTSDSGVQNVIFDEEVSESPKLSSSLHVIMFIERGISNVTKSSSLGYIRPPFKNIATVRLSSVFLLI